MKVKSHIENKAKPLLTMDKYEVLRTLGKGASGRVLLAQRKDTDK